MPIMRSNITKQLVPGLNKIVGLSYKDVAEDHTAMYDVETSERSFEEEVLMSGLGEAPVKQEGESVAYDDASEGWVAKYKHETIALAAAVSEEAMEDNLYDTESKRLAKMLGRAMASAKQQKAADVYNNAFSSFETADGVSLLNASHPLANGGTLDNVGAADLSETALENDLIAIDAFTDDRGILVSFKAKTLIIPSALQFKAFKILKSDLSTTTATNSTTGVTNTNDVNALKGLFPGGIHVNNRLTDLGAYFIRTDCPDGMKMFQRTKLSMQTDGDFDTGNFKMKARERYAFGATDFRGLYGSPGA